MNKDLETLANTITAFLKAAIINLEPQRNDLRQSNLWRTIEWRVDKNVIQIIAAEYIVFIDSGRKAGVKRVPIGSLLSWIRQYKINTTKKITDIQLAFAIQTAIFQRGIKPRPFLEAWENKSIEYVAETIGELFEAQIIRNFETLLIDKYGKR